MKKRTKHIIIGLVLSSILGVGLAFALFLKNEIRDPKKILVQYSNSTFGISIQPIIDSINITYFKEQWCGNGDGESTIRFNYKANNNFFQNFEKLPIKEYIDTDFFSNSNRGYYLYDVDSHDNRNFSILIFYPDSMTGILYYRVM